MTEWRLLKFHNYEEIKTNEQTINILYNYLVYQNDMRFTNHCKQWKMDIRIMRHTACRPGSAVEFSQGCDGFLFFFAMGVHCLFFENLRSGDLPDALTFACLFRSDLAYFCYNFMYRLQNVFMKLKRAKLIRLEETVTIQSTCFVKDVQLIAWYLFTQNKSWVFLTYINIKLLYIKQKLIFQVSTREILVFLYYGIKTFSDIGVK